MSFRDGAIFEVSEATALLRAALVLLTYIGFTNDVRQWCASHQG